MSAETATINTAADPARGGPRTPDGKRIAARNATTHGLFARDVVLTHLGEDPAGYEALLAELTAQLHPTNLLETHYVEKIAASSWRLRRLHRWQAQLFEDPGLTEDEALSRLDRVMGHETALHRQIDTAVKMLAKELPRLFEDRARREALAELHTTERECRQDETMDWTVAEKARARLPAAPRPPTLDPARLDNVPAAQPICQNEPAPAFPPHPPAAGGSCERSEQGGGSPAPPELGAGGPPSSPASEGVPIFPAHGRKTGDPRRTPSRHDPDGVLRHRRRAV